MAQIDSHGNVITDNFLITRNILTIAKKDVRLIKNKQETLITVEDYENHLAHWRYFRTTGVLNDHLNYEYDYVRNFFAFCSRMNQPYMFITPDEMMVALDDSGMLPYVISDGKTTKQIYRAVFREYFTSIDSNAEASEVEKMPYIRRCIGEMIIGRHFFPLFFEGMDKQLEWITLKISPMIEIATVTLADVDNNIVHTYGCSIDDSSGFPRSHLDILKDMRLAFQMTPLIES